MNNSWCNEYHYNGTIGNNTITEIQSFNKNASNNDTLLFTVFFGADYDCDSRIIFQNTEAFYQGYRIDFSTTSIVIRVGSGGNNTDNPPNNDTTDNITENTLPVANIDCSYSGESVYFNASNSTSNKNITSYLWDFGDNTVGAGITATHNYTKSDNYTVTLTITNEEGLTSTKTMTINVTFIPEVIPNNNGDNGWILWVIIIIIIIILVAIFMSRYDIEI